MADVEQTATVGQKRTRDDDDATEPAAKRPRAAEIDTSGIVLSTILKQLLQPAVYAHGFTLHGAIKWTMWDDMFRGWLRDKRRADAVSDADLAELAATDERDWTDATIAIVVGFFIQRTRRAGYGGFELQVVLDSIGQDLSNRWFCNADDVRNAVERALLLGGTDNVVDRAFVRACVLGNVRLVGTQRAPVELEDTERPLLDCGSLAHFRSLSNAGGWVSCDGEGARLVTELERIVDMLRSERGQLEEKKKEKEKK